MLIISVYMHGQFCCQLGRNTACGNLVRVVIKKVCLLQDDHLDFPGCVN